MMTEADIKTDLRDLVYIQEEIYNLIKRQRIPKAEKEKILDTLKQKQVILSKIIHFFNSVSGI